MSIKTLGVDLGKLSCHVIGQDQHGKVVEKRKIQISKFAEENQVSGLALCPDIIFPKFNS